MSDAEPLAPQYSAAAIEAPLYADWQARGLFAPSTAPGARPFVIVIPPPNVTDVLHMGHGLNNTVQDVLVRFERMRGRAALWLPGTDHAGIATQNVVEKLLAAEGRTRFDLGREAFVARVWQHVRAKGGIILQQLKAIGCSCDWSRTRFTFDPAMSRAVREVFVRLWEEGLIYRGYRVIHWCPRCHTALSDEEAEHADVEGALYYIRYPMADGGEPITVATTRPETLLGDVAVAVNPEDGRHRAFVGRHVVLPIAELEIPIIADEHVEAGFGTGFVKITPAHDADDFEVGRRHDLATPIVMTADARMGDAALGGKPGGRVPAPLFGMDRFEARKAIVAMLKERGLLEKVESRLHAVRHCYRCDTVVEPRLSDQWFVTMEPLAAPALEAYRQGRVRFIPERRGDEFEQWLTGIRDWNISRQLWWGHRIPVWYCDRCGLQQAFREDPVACPACGGPLRQDEDVLDTWFSSWLWPFSTLGWPEATADLERYYPTDVLVTAPEIIFFWVARMIMAGIHFVGRVPFHTVYLHGTVRDTHHVKMSKSLGNGIDPIEVVNRYGADALRFAVTNGLGVGTDIILDPNDLDTSFASGRNFANKLWNVGRLLLSSLGDGPLPALAEVPAGELTLPDRWIVSRLARVARETTEHLERFRLNDAVGTPYHFLWDDFADWYLEEIKPRLRDEAPGGAAARAVAAHVFDRVLRLLHPAMPFITDALYRRLPGRGDASIMVAPWPGADAGRDDPDAERDFAFVQALVNAVREVRAEYGVKPGAELKIVVSRLAPRQAGAIAQAKDMIRRLAKVGALETAAGEASVLGRVGSHALLPDGAEVFVVLGDAIDVGKECARLKTELTRLDGQLAAVRGKLGSESFRTRAPADVVARETEKERQWTARREALAGKLAALGCA
ncbi:MAG TPA: valine--tRNA ligase [Gemmatimonadales bacterium]|nr:valine--tRNA ligase [Gemmatimonadales bacterium]